jgi:hypothetical protein
MEQRPLRLGDILDDYCPRERRVTNHAVVAMIEDTVKQTRCTTCDAEHAYKGGQAPRRRKKETPSALYKEVLAGKPDDVPVRIASEASAPVPPAEDAASLEMNHGDESPNDSEVSATLDVNDVDVEPRPDVEEGPVHRQLIRAQLPRIEGQKEERRPTDFTIRQPNARGNAHGNFRGGGNDRMRSGRGFGGNSGSGGHGGNHRGNGHRPHGGARFAGARPGQGQGRGQGGGFRSGQQQRQGGGGRKRSR